jgi:hypothetical protein
LLEIGVGHPGLFLQLVTEGFFGRVLARDFLDPFIDDALHFQSVGGVILVLGLLQDQAGFDHLLEDLGPGDVFGALVHAQLHHLHVEVAFQNNVAPHFGHDPVENLGFGGEQRGQQQ